MPQIIFRRNEEVCRLSLQNETLIAEHNSETLLKSLLAPVEFQGTEITRDTPEMFFNALICKYDPNPIHAKDSGQFMAKPGAKRSRFRADGRKSGKGSESKAKKPRNQNKDFRAIVRDHGKLPYEVNGSQSILAAQRVAAVHSGEERTGNTMGWADKNVSAQRRERIMDRMRQELAAREKAAAELLNTGKKTTEPLPGVNMADLENRIKDHVDKNPNANMRDLQHVMGHKDVDPQNPLANPVNQAVANLRDRGEVEVHQPRFGQPWVNIARKPKAAVQTAASADHTKAPPVFSNADDIKAATKAGYAKPVNVTHPQKHAAGHQWGINNAKFGMNQAGVDELKKFKGHLKNKEDLNRQQGKIGDADFKAGSRQALDAMQQHIENHLKAKGNANDMAPPGVMPTPPAPMEVKGPMEPIARVPEFPLPQGMIDAANEYKKIEAANLAGAGGDVRRAAINQIKAGAMKLKSGGKFNDSAGKAYDAVVAGFDKHPDAMHLDEMAKHADNIKIKEDNALFDGNEKMANDLRGGRIAHDNLRQAVIDYRAGKRIEKAYDYLPSAESSPPNEHPEKYEQDVAAHVDNHDPAKAHALESGKMPTSFANYKEMGKDKDCINDVYHVVLDNGAQGVFKPDAGQHGSWDEVYGKGVALSGHEKAASVVNDALGFNIVKKTVIKKGVYKDKPAVGSVMEFIHNATTAEDNRGAIGRISQQDKIQIHALDLIIGNLDRHRNNWMIDDHDKAWGIDNGGAFATNALLKRVNGMRVNGINMAFSPYQIEKANPDKKTIDSVAKFINNRPAIEASLKGLVTPKQVDDMFSRATFLHQVMSRGKFGTAASSMGEFLKNHDNWIRTGDVGQM